MRVQVPPPAPYFARAVTCPALTYAQARLICPHIQTAALHSWVFRSVSEKDLPARSAHSNPTDIHDSPEMKELLGWLPSISAMMPPSRKLLKINPCVRVIDCIDIAVVIPPHRARANRRLSFKRQSVAHLREASSCPSVLDRSKTVSANGSDQ